MNSRVVVTRDRRNHWLDMKNNRRSIPQGGHGVPESPVSHWQVTSCFLREKLFRHLFVDF